MRLVKGLDGMRWRVGRRWLLWRPLILHVGKWSIAEIGGLLVALLGEDIGFIIIVPVAALLVVPILAVLAIYAIEWATVLAITPIAVAVGVMRGSHVVYAKIRPPFFESMVDRDAWRTLTTYRMGVRGWGESHRLARRVRQEIKATGAPQSLGAAQWGPVTPTGSLFVLLRGPRRVAVPTLGQSL